MSAAGTRGVGVLRNQWRGPCVQRSLWDVTWALRKKYKKKKHVKMCIRGSRLNIIIKNTHCVVAKTRQKTYKEKKI